MQGSGVTGLATRPVLRPYILLITNLNESSRSTTGCRVTVITFAPAKGATALCPAAATLKSDSANGPADPCACSANVAFP
jgi:hypothetical protein